jgi:hypothetical protein
VAKRPPIRRTRIRLKLLGRRDLERDKRNPFGRSSASTDVLDVQFRFLGRPSGRFPPICRMARHLRPWTSIAMQISPQKRKKKATIPPHVHANDGPPKASAAKGEEKPSAS